MEGLCDNIPAQVMSLQDSRWWAVPYLVSESVGMPRWMR